MSRRNEIRASLIKKWLSDAAEEPDNFLGYARCEVKFDRGCTGRAIEGHEPILRSRGGSITDRKNVMLTCRHCHDQIHQFPAISTYRGFMRSQPAKEQP